MTEAGGDTVIDIPSEVVHFNPFRLRLYARMPPGV